MQISNKNTYKIYNLKSLLKNTKVVCIAMKNFFIDNT